MSIIAILMLMSGAVFLTIRDQFLVDSAAEEALSYVRDAQNRAISIEENSIGSPGKVWGTCFQKNVNKVTLISYYGNSTLTKASPPENSYTPPKGVTMDTRYGNASGDYCIAFSAPFATTYVDTYSGFAWSQSTSPTKDWVSTGDEFTGTNELKITFTRAGHSNTVSINSRGDAHIE